MSEAPDAGAASWSVAPSQVLAPAQLGDVANALLVLARELWVVKGPQRMPEALLATNGIVVSGAVADHQPGAKLAIELEAERSRYTAALIAALCPPTGDAP